MTVSVPFFLVPLCGLLGRVRGVVAVSVASLGLSLVLPNLCMECFLFLKFAGRWGYIIFVVKLFWDSPDGQDDDHCEAKRLWLEMQFAIKKYVVRKSIKTYF